MRIALYKLGLVVGGMLLLFGQTGATKPASGQRIDIIAKRFRYEPNDITIKKGQPVTLVFHSQDVTHGFVSDDFHVKTDIPKHQTSQVTFTPEQSGDFGGKCAHFCGEGHGGMQLTIHVAQ
jgi:cytochrome c oxidase subunit 2